MCPPIWHLADGYGIAYPHPNVSICRHSYILTELMNLVRGPSTKGAFLLVLHNDNDDSRSSIFL